MDPTSININFIFVVHYDAWEFSSIECTSKNYSFIKYQEIKCNYSAKIFHICIVCFYRTLYSSNNSLQLPQKYNVSYLSIIMKMWLVGRSCWQETCSLDYLTEMYVIYYDTFFFLYPINNGLQLPQKHNVFYSFIHLFI